MASKKKELAALSICIFIGVFLSTLPCLIFKFRLGSFVWIADNDDILYLSVISKSLFNHPWVVGDPVSVGQSPAIYPWVQFIPGVLIGKLFSLGPLEIYSLARVWAGFSMACGWFLIVRHFIPRLSWVVFLVIILLSDSGLLKGQPFYLHLIKMKQVLSLTAGELLPGKPDLMSQWRIITPGLSLWYWLLYFWLLARALNQPKRLNLLLAGAALGSLYYCYFYYWTTAMLGLLLTFALDKKNRKVYLSTTLIGTLLGIPALVASAQIKNNSNSYWLPRADNFLPIAHFSEFLIPKIAIVFLLIVFVIVWKKKRDFLFLACHALAALLLLNQQIITGFQMSNFHWNYALGPTLTLLGLLLFFVLLTKICESKKYLFPITLGLILLTFLDFFSGTYLRTIDSLKTEESLFFTSMLKAYQQQQFNPGVSRLESNSVVAGDTDFINFAVILENQRPLYHYTVEISPAVNNQELDTRIVLQSYLKGTDRKSFEQEQRRHLQKMQTGPWIRDKNLFEFRILQRMAVYDQVIQNPLVHLDRFKVKYVGFRTGQKLPLLYTKNWKEIQSGPYWQIWQRL